jgi:DNA-directed RNA polymerase subunit H (RpoH/RPB5)
MDEIREIYNAWNTCRDMIHDRGFKFPEGTEYNDVDMESFRELYRDKNCDMLAENGPRRIYIKFVLTPKIKPAQLREFFDEIMTKYISESDDFVVVIRNKLSSAVVNLNKEKEYRHIQLWWTKQLQMNPTRHVLVPRHELCSSTETEAVMEKYAIQNKSKFPAIERTDIQVRYLGLKPGDIVKIYRENAVFYRHVI